MKLFNKDKKPIEHVQLSTRHIALRWIAVAVCLILAVVTIGYALNALITVNSGWQVVEHQSTEITCAADFVVNYNFGDGGSGATTAYKRISMLYSDAAENAYWLFNKDAAHETIVGMRAINAAPNTVMTVDPVLYNAFAQVQAAGDRSIYLAPLYAEHDSMLACETDAFAELRDPAKDADAAAYAALVAAYARDAQHINIELMENNQIRLYVSDAYLAFAEENAIDTLVDFHWMKNAFIIDYIADTLVQNGFTQGAISSVDGFVRNLDDSGESYLFNVYDRPGEVAYLAAALQYAGRRSIVSLRAFPVSQDDAILRYYVYENGAAVAPQMCAQNGLRQNAVPSLVAYAADAGCAEVLLKTLPLYTQTALDTDELQALAQEGLYTVWCDQNTVMHTEPDAKLVNLYTDETVTYQPVLAE